MKYRVTLEDRNIWIKDREVKVVAVSANNAKEIAEMRYKGKIASKAVRLDKAPSTVQTMKELREEFIKAKDEGNKELASRSQKAFYATLASLQAEMDVVAFNMAKKCLPDLPPMGK